MNINYYSEQDTPKINYYNPLTDFKVNSLISNDGCFSSVYDVFNIRSNENLAMKINKEKDITALNEIKVMSLLGKHNHIVQLTDIYFYQDKYYLLLEKGYGGNLFNYLKNNIVTEKYAKKIILQMVETIDYIHSNFIIIKDIKLDNVLLKTNQFESDIMLCDFNLSIILSKEYSLTGDRGGTLYYVAPEVLSSQHCYSYKSDIWSLGVCLYYLLGRQLPFDGENNSVVLTKIMNENYNFDNKYWTLITQHAKHLISNIINYDINKRYTLSQIIQHPWFRTN
jgi:serine/threonine protein kinase